MDINQVTQFQNATLTPQGQNTNLTDLDSVDFMALIIAQMRNQDPLSPQDNSDFMAQLAQFETLSQMTRMADGLRVMQSVNELSSATAMIGRTVTGRQVDGVPAVADVVARELFGAPYFELNADQLVAVDADQRVVDAIADRANAGAEVTGVVDRVIVGFDGIPMLFVDGKVVDLFTVAEVA